MLGILFACLAFLAVVGIAVIACFYGNGNKELNPVDRFATPLPSQNPVAPMRLLSANDDNDKDEDDTETEQREFAQTKIQIQTHTQMMPSSLLPLHWDMVKRLPYQIDEQKLDTFLYVYHRHVGRAMMAGNNEREMIVAEQNLKQSVMFLMQSAVQSVQPAVPQLSREIQNGFEYFLERYCDTIIRRDAHYHNDCFAVTLPFLQEAFAQTDMNTSDALWFTEAVGVLKEQLAKHRSLSQDVYLLYHFYAQSKTQSGIRFPRRVQKLLDKHASILPFMMEQSVRMMVEQKFPELLTKSRNKRDCTLLLMSVLHQNLYDFTSVL